jgi:hypothetical protein
MPTENHVSVEGFSADHNDPSGLRFPAIERAASKVFSSESGCSVTVKNLMMRAFEAELYAVTRDGSRHSTSFDFGDLATAAPIDQELWWERAIRSAWEKIKPR